MPFLPVAAREVREASRQPRTYRWRWVTAAATLALLFFVYRLSRHSPSQGRELFIAISTAAYIYCLLAGAVRTSDTISEEKRDNTLGLLFLTDLKGWDIVFGKLLSSSVNCFFGLLAMFPMLAIPVIMGGVMPAEFAKVVLSLINTLLLSISWGFLISSLFRQSVVTISASLLIMIFFGGPLVLVGIYMDEELQWDTLAEFLMFFTPTQSHVNCFASPAKVFDHYWTPLLINHAIAWINLRLSIYFLPRFWQDVPKNKKTERWRERIRAWRFGIGKAKAHFRTRLLDQNPLFWLSNRERVSSLWLMIACLVVLTGATILGAAVSSRNPRARVEEMMAFWFVGMALVHIMIAFRLSMAASHRLAEDRRSGALELLLGTELSVREILRGHFLALRRQFFGPALIAFLGGILACFMFLLVASHEIGIGQLWETFIEIVLRMFRRGANSEWGWLLVILISIQTMLFLNWIALAWVGMWFGLRERRSGFSTWATLALVLVPPWIVLILIVATLEESGAMRYITDETMFAIVFTSGWFLGLGHLLTLAFWARKNLLNRFRAVASDRYSGPRPFPWRPMARFAFRFAAATGVVVVLLISIRAWINHRGEKLWHAARAAVPQYAQAPAQPVIEEIPDHENLAKSQIFIAMSAPGRNRKQITWNLGPNQNGNIIWNWTQRQRRNLGPIRDSYVDGKVLKNTNHVSDAAAVLEGLSIYDKDIAMLQADAAARPRTRFPLASNQPGFPNQSFQAFQAFFYNARDLRPALRLLTATLALRASARIAIGENPFDDIQLALRVAEGIAHDPQSIVHYHEMLLDLAQPIYDGIAARRWTNDELKRFQDYFSQQDFWTRYELFREDTVRKILEEHDRLIAARQGQGRSGESAVTRQFPSGLVRKTQAEFLRWGFNDLPKAVDPNARLIHVDVARELEKSRPYFGNRGWRQPDQFFVAMRSLGFMQTTASQISLACALERFRHDHGKLPVRIEELRPQYIAAIPNDAFTGKSLSCKITGEHYVIHSVGFDGLDDKAAYGQMFGSWMIWQGQTNGDWVWNSEALDAPRPRPRKK